MTISEHPLRSVLSLLVVLSCSASCRRDGNENKDESTGAPPEIGDDARGDDGSSDMNVPSKETNADQDFQDGDDSEDSHPADFTYPRRLLFQGLGAIGIFDPSITQDPATDRLWMSFSRVESSGRWPTLAPGVVSTRLAFSDDLGITWHESGETLAATQDVELPLPPPANAGAWVSEVSRLVYDPGAPVSERWKLVWHHYLLVGSSGSAAERRFEHGWLGLKMAASPEDLAASPEIKWIGTRFYDPVNDLEGGTTGSPVGGRPQVYLGDIHASLSSCALVTEPGLYATPDALYLSALCGQVDETNTLVDHPIVLLRCASPCRPDVASSWQYLGIAVNDADAMAFGFDDGFSASDLVAAPGGVYLVVSPAATSPFVGFYLGCRAYRFEDLNEATILRDAAGLPMSALEAAGSSGTFNGACTYHDAMRATGGLLLGEVNMGQELPLFRLFFTGKNL